MSLPNVSSPPTDTSTLVPKSLVDAKGDLFVGTADDTVARKAVGTDGFALAADSSQSDGLAYVPVNGYASAMRSGLIYVPHGSVDGNNVAVANQKPMALPWVPGKSVTVVGLAVHVGSVGSTGSVHRLGIYNDNDGFPGTLLVDAGTVDTATSTGVKIATLSQAVVKGTRYWLVAVQQGAPSPNTAQLRGRAGTGGGTNALLPVDSTNFSNGGSMQASTNAAWAGALPSGVGADWTIQTGGQAVGVKA